MSFLVQRSDLGEFRRRYRWLVFVVFLGFVGLGAKLVQLQIVEADLHRSQARRNITGEIRLATTRGVIRDAFGKVLAANRPSYNVYVVPEAIDLKTTWPMAAPVGPFGTSVEPRSDPGPASPGPSFLSRISTVPSMTSANSSCGAVRQLDVPSARIVSSTYWRFRPTTTFSYGREPDATSKMFEKAYRRGSSSMRSISPF